MNVKIEKGMLNEGQVRIISSKSDGHRAMIAAALGEEECVLFLEGWNEDLEATGRCIEALGGEVVREPSGTLIVPIPKDNDAEAVLDCGESGSTLRFLLPVAAALGRKSLFMGKGRLPERPIGVLLEELRQHGCTISGDCLPVELSGQLQGGIFTLPGNISSQFITGLLFALPLLEQDSEIRLTTEVESKGYIDMTLRTLESFGIQVKKTEHGWFIPGKQTYAGPRMRMAEGDWSSAAFWLTAGAICGKIGCQGVDLSSAQGDKEIVSLLERFGAESKIVQNQVTMSKGALKGIRIDAAQIPDLVPILCIAAAAAEGKTEIFHAGRLRLKESDRLAAMADCLQRIGVEVEEKPDGLIITGGCQPPKGEIILDARGDHRIIMAMAIAAVSLGIELTIEGADAVNKSYPSFFAELTKLGGVVDVL